jgi:hypothetical protein
LLSFANESRKSKVLTLNHSQLKPVLERFKKPALKRVRISADQMLKTLLGGKGKAEQIDMRQNLKKK